MRELSVTGRVLLTALAVVLTVPAAPIPAWARPAPRAPAEFVALSDVDPTILQEIRYFTPHNFTGAPVSGYREPMCILTATAARALHRAQVRLWSQGYSLKVYDCYRPQRAVDRFAAWAKDPAAQSMKGEFFPRVGKGHLFADGYIAGRSGHSRGSTMDVTLVKLPAVRTRPYRPGEPLVPCYARRTARFPDDSVDMGTGFDCFDTLAHTLDPRVHGGQRAARLLLKNTLEAAGFVNLAEEWWHFTYKAEPFRNTYFNFPVSRESLTRP
jgi:D-alanyl-D-alanine dipeptidase